MRRTFTVWIQLQKTKDPLQVKVSAISNKSAKFSTKRCTHPPSPRHIFKEEHSKFFSQTASGKYKHSGKSISSQMTRLLLQTCFRPPHRKKSPTIRVQTELFPSSSRRAPWPRLWSPSSDINNRGNRLFGPNKQIFWRRKNWCDVDSIQWLL